MVASQQLGLAAAKPAVRIEHKMGCSRRKEHRYPVEGDRAVVELEVTASEAERRLNKLADASAIEVRRNATNARERILCSLFPAAPLQAVLRHVAPHGRRQRAALLPVAHAVAGSLIPDPNDWYVEQGLSYFKPTFLRYSQTVELYSPRRHPFFYHRL